MKEITATDFSRNFKKVMDLVEFKSESIKVFRNDQPIAKIIPESHELTAIEAMSDLFRALPDPAGKNWEGDSRSGNFSSSLKNPWDS